MSGLFRWSMRHGAKLLFALALFQLLIGLIPSFAALLSETSQMTVNHNYSPTGLDYPLALHLQLLAGSLLSAAFPFFGALVIHRLDRRPVARDAEDPQ